MYNAEIVAENLEDYDPIHSYRIWFVYHGSNGKIEKDVCGTAKCSPNDKYNDLFGFYLAKTKAYEAYHHEVKKLMIAETYRPEWKKKQKMSFDGVLNGLCEQRGYYMGNLNLSFQTPQAMRNIGEEVSEKFNTKPVKVTIEEV